MPGELLTFQLTLKLQASENLNPIHPGSSRQYRPQ
jgi:hypothetical protein